MRKNETNAELGAQNYQNLLPPSLIQMHQMKNSYLLICFCFIISALSAQPNQSPSDAVTSFLRTLSPEQLRQTQYSFSDTLRSKWTNLPIGLVPRAGIAYGTLSDQSRLAYHRLLSSMLSSQGYLKITSIMKLDDILNTLYQEAYDSKQIDERLYKMMKDLKWAHGNYYIAIWGTPQDKEPWGLSFGGHHLALSLTQIGNKTTMSPFFIGTDPSEIKTSKYAGWRVLSKEEDYGFLLINTLTEKQRAKAVLKQEVPGDIITNPQSSQRIDSYYGIAAKEMDAAQKDLLRLVIEEYTHNFDHVTAHRLSDQINKNFDKIYFAWIGELVNNKPHYYIINSPDFLIEYDNVGFQNDGNHIHAILREKGNDFGVDILKNHYLTSDHHKK